MLLMVIERFLSIWKVRASIITDLAIPMLEYIIIYITMYEHIHIVMDIAILGMPRVQ